MTQLNRIFCSTDLSVESDEAMRYAFALARIYKAQVFVYHCEEVAPMAILSEVQHRVTETIERHVHWLKPEGIEWEPVISVIDRGSGDTALAISREAALRGADLIVLQSRRRPLSAALFGSTAEAVCHTAPCPVLVTHPREHEFIDEKTGEVHLAKILAGDDFSAYSTDALRFAFSLAQEFQSELHVLHVAAEPQTAAVAHGHEGLHLINNAAQYIEGRLKSHVPSDVALWCKVESAMREGHPEQEIIRYATEHNADLICIGSHGRGRGWGELLGSTTDRVLRRAPCPVLVARPVDLTNVAPPPTII